jgi:hypothetical protein
VQRKLAWMITEITKAQVLALRLGQLKQAGRAKHYHVSMGKMNNVAGGPEVRSPDAGDPRGGRDHRRLPVRATLV